MNNDNIPYALDSAATCSIDTNPNTYGAYCCTGSGGELPQAGPVLGNSGPAGYTGGRVIWDTPDVPSCLPSP